MGRIIFTPKANIYIGDAGELGRGVFCGEDIKKGEIIEIAPAILVEDQTDLDNYVYAFGEEDGHDHYAVGLGYTSMYNHSTSPNAVYTLDEDEDGVLIEITALREIARDEQIFINYNGDPSDQTPWDFADE